MKTIASLTLTFLALTFCTAFLDTAGAQPLTVTTIAGQFGVQDFAGYGAVGIGTQAHFDQPGQLHADQAGNLYVCDAECIKKISPDLHVTVLAGHLGTAPGDYGYLDGKGTNALFNYITDCAIDTNGNVYVVDNRNFVIRKISPAGAVTTFAGNGQSVYIDATGTNAGFTGPSAIAIDSAGNFYVTDLDSNGNRIRKITPDGVVSTLAGGPYNYEGGDGVGTNAQFVSPNGLAVDAAGTVYVADEHTIRKITPDGTVTTWVGDRSNNFKDSDGLGLNAEFDGASEIALDRSGGLYVVDTFGHTIRYVSAAGAVSTVAGAVGGYPSVSNDGVGSGALFGDPAGVTVGLGGNVYITDLGESTILEGAPPPLGPINSVSESAGVSPIRSNNPWQFTAVFTDIVSDVRLRVQSTTTTNIEGSWTDLPGNVDVTDQGGNWTFNSTDVPVGTQYFRVVASAPGYFDRASAAVGPETVLGGIAQFGAFTFQTATPFYHNGTAWTFNIVETSVISGLGLRVQSSPDGNTWNTLSDGQMSTSDSVNWTVTSFTVPTGTISFRVVASASTYSDLISDPPLGPYTIVAGLPDIGFFDHSNGGTPVRSSNPWQFLATYTDLVPGLLLRVQSTSTPDEGDTWQDLPGVHYMTNNAGAWTLAKTDVPTGVQYFRAVASAPGYVDGVSPTNAPENVLPGFDLWGYFSYATTFPYSTATFWSFEIRQTSQISGMSLQMQSSTTPDDPNSWSGLPGGGQMNLETDGVNWGLLTTNLTIGTNVSFRVVASAPNYVDLVSAELGPFDIERPFPVFTTTIMGGTFAVLDDGVVTSIFHGVGAVANFFLTGATTVVQGAITLTADLGSAITMTIDKGHVLKAAGVNVQANSTVIASGAIDGPVSVGIPIVSHDGGSIVSHDGGSFAQDAQTAALATANLKAGLLTQDGGGLTSKTGSGVSVGSKTPITSSPNIPALTQPTFTGQMTINGNYSQFPGTALIIGIAGTNTLDQGAQQYDQLVVNGHVNFVGGTIVFVLLDPDDQTNLANAFQPPDGASFDVVVASNIVVGTVHIFGPIWGDGLFLSGSVVTRDDGLQAVRLTATHIPPQLFIQNADSGLQLVYGTNYTGYTVESSPDLVNWSAFSTGTNVVELNPTDASQFFRLSKP